MSRAAEVLAKLEASPDTQLEPPAPEPEEPAVDAESPADGETLADGAVAAPAEPAKPQPFAPQFAALAKRESRVTKQEREFRSQVQREKDSLATERAAMARDRAELDEFRIAMKDPQKFMAYADRRGMTGEQLAAYYAGEGSKENQGTAALQELRDEIKALKQAREDDARRGGQQNQQAIEQQFIEHSRDETAYPYANAIYEPHEVLAIAKEELALAQRAGLDVTRIPDSAVMQAVETRAKAKAERLTKLQPSPREPAPNGAPPRSTSGANANGARTLTNGQAAAATSPRVAPATREERIAAIKRRVS